MAVSNSSSQTIDRCRVCDEKVSSSLLNLGKQPLANSLRENVTEELPIFPLEICRCQVCGTVQLTETVAPELLFKKYVWVTGTSEGARSYSELFCERLSARCQSDSLFVVEVASNDGTFLKRFTERGDRVLGVDPAQNIAQIAQEDGIPTVADFFGQKIAAQIVERDGAADAVFARNVIPHVADANDVVAGMAMCLKEKGTGAIEFHRSDVILEELHYDSIYHEHLFYHSLQSMSSLLGRFGLYPFDVTESPISGGSLVVYFSKTIRQVTAIYEEMLTRENSIGVGREEPWIEFGQRCRRHRSALRELVLSRCEQGKHMIGYGASARSSTLLNFCGINSSHLKVIADRAPLKHDTYTPGTDILIVPPDQAFSEKPDVVLLLGWNFQNEILSQIRDEFGWKGEIIVPLPHDPVVIK